jgi:hypothetical protein
MHNLLFVRLLLEQKAKKVDQNGPKLVKILYLPFKVDDFGEDPICI